MTADGRKSIRTSSRNWNKGRRSTRCGKANGVHRDAELSTRNYCEKQARTQYCNRVAVDEFPDGVVRLPIQTSGEGDPVKLHVAQPGGRKAIRGQLTDGTTKASTTGWWTDDIPVLVFISRAEEKACRQAAKSVVPFDPQLRFNHVQVGISVVACYGGGTSQRSARRVGNGACGSAIGIGVARQCSAATAGE